MSRVPRTLAMAACALASAFVVLPGPATAASARAVRVGSPPLIPSAARVLGTLAGSTKLDVTVALAPRDPSALAAFANAVSTPGSPLYRHYITPAEFAQRFAPTPAQAASVQASLRAHGLDPGPVSANGLAIPVTSTAGTVAGAFSISLSRVLMPGGRLAFATTAAPLLDATVAKLVQGVVGLNTLSIPRPLSVRSHSVLSAPLIAPHIATGGPQPCAAASSTAPGQQAYTIDQIAAAYDFSGLYAQGNEGAGQTIAIYEL